MKIKLFCAAVFLIVCHPSMQSCPEEVSHKGISVLWHESLPANNVESDPVCYHENDIISRNCTESKWSPSLNETKACLKVVKYVDLTSCPPGFYKISDHNDEYCYQVGESSPWDHPCFENGGASVVTDLTEEELEYLIGSLVARNISRYFWLPAQRQKLFNPVVWFIPGPMWGRRVEICNGLRIQASITKNCLLFDIEQRILITDVCTKSYPSLCFYVNDLHYPAKCPDGYHAFRFKPDNGTCFGIELSDSELGLPYDDFLQTKCNNPMKDSQFNDLTRFLFKKIAEINDLSSEKWCWFNASYARDGIYTYERSGNDSTRNYTLVKSPALEGVINKDGTLGLMNKMTNLTCMACEADVIYGETELLFEYNEAENMIYLTIYFPSGLWKYDFNDKGIQCFSDAKGFVRVVDINDIPFIEVNSLSQEQTTLNLNYIEKIVYAINLVTDRTAQYWCEGHTQNFSFISTNKIIVSPKGNDFHVFSLVFKFYTQEDEIQDVPDSMTDLIENITRIFKANKVLIMDILEYTLDYIHILLHLHVPIEEIYEDDAMNLLQTYNNLKERAIVEFPKLNYTFINISSSIYCLPTTSDDIFTLQWEMNLIGHISAPKQFCLQANGLPVKRHCHGSYLLGGLWGEVEGTCDTNYIPSEKTTFLYNFATRPGPNNYTNRFLIDGLGFVLENVDIIIPADIYYLSMSLQQILNIAQNNYSNVDMGDIENIAWVIDRVMVFNNQYLNLAQTLNSTNVILDSVNNIIETLAQRNINDNHSKKYYDDDIYQIAVKPQFIVQISYPFFNNITGIAISNKQLTNKFTEMIIQPLYKNTSLNEVLSIENLEIASWVPTYVLESLKKYDNDSDKNTINREDIHIVINVFHNDAIFQEVSPNKYTVNSRIIGITIPGFISNLKYPVPLVFKQIIQQNHDGHCGYWDFQTQKLSHVPGFWTNNGCFLLKSLNNITICECFHLTHFGQLLMISDASNNEENFKHQNHTMALNIITLTGSFMSLLGIVGIWVTALVFPNWRKKAGTKVLLQLSTAISLPLILVIVFNLDNTIFNEDEGKYMIAKNKKILCIILGALLHYSILASFMWMLITAVLQFIRYVRVLGVRRPSRFMAKFTLIGWGTPLIPVIIILAVNIDNYIPHISYSKRICYPSGYNLIIGVVVPICIILLINVALFISVLYAISQGPDGKMKTTDIDLVRTQLRLSIFLFFLLGLTWIFGIFSFSNNLVWSYLFCLTSTLQGFVLFIYFVICDPTTRNLWITLMKPQFSTSSSRNSITSLSTN